MLPMSYSFSPKETEGFGFRFPSGISYKLKVRIIGGIAKGQKLKVRGGDKNIRPTLARVKKSVFDIISKRVIGAKILDLYSGTGNLGIEGLSRGASSVVSVEKELIQYKTIIENYEKIGFKDKAKIYKDDVFKIIPKLYNRKEKFGIIIFAPPFLKNFVNPTLESLAKYNILEDDGLIIVEHHYKENVY